MDSSRFSHSMHPSLRGMAGASFSAEAAAQAASMGGSVGVEWVPYPTPAQHSQIEAQFRRAVAEAGPNDTPVRQPPTMLAGMQRTDLTPEARGRVLQQLAPPSQLERKYKIVFDSSARTEPQRTGPGDFAVRVTPDVLPVKANGFELIGYSFPRAEWTLEPGETSIPTRFGWCASPGSRLYGLYAPDDNGSRALLSAELPLPSNPILHAELLPATLSASAAIPPLPARVRLTLARRVGSVPALLASLRLFTVENLGPVASYRPSSRASILDEIQPLYVAGTAPPDAERPLSAHEVASAPGDFAAAPQSVSPAHQLTLSDPALVAALSAYGPGPIPLTAAAVLRFAPPPTAADLGRVLSAQFRHLLAHRRFMEDADPEMGRVAIHRAEVALAAEASRHSPTPRLLLRVGWDRVRWREGAFVSSFASSSSSASASRNSFAPSALGVPSSSRPPPPGPLDVLAALGGVASDGMGARFGLPSGYETEVRGGQGQGGDPGATLSTPWQVEYVSARPALLPPETTAEASPLPDTASLEAYFQSLNTSATSLRFAPPSSPSAASFTIPILFGGALHPVSVPAGEYRPWGLARAITEAARAPAALRALQLLATPAGLAHGNTIAGFRFASAAATPLPFGMAWDAAAADPSGTISPARLGYRPLRYDGQSAYDPELLGATGTLAPITFPAADLGLGAPSPLPAVPYFLPASGNKKLQIQMVGADAVGVAETGAEASITAATGPSGALSLSLARPALFHHLQPLSLQVDAPADEVRLLDVSGGGGVALLLAGESSGVGAALETFRFDPATFPLVPAGTAGTSTRASLSVPDVLAVLRLLFAPSAATLEGATLGATLAALLGRPNSAYGAAPAPASPGDYRALLDLFLASPSVSGSGSAQLPSGATVDGWLRRLGSNQDVPAMFALLSETLLRVEALRVLSDLPLNGANGGVSSGVLASVLRAHVTAASDPARTLLPSPAADLVRTALHLSDASDLAEGSLSVASPSLNPAELLVGARYLLSEPSARVDLGASVNLSDASRIRIDPLSATLTVLPGAFGGGAGPHVLALSLPGDPLPAALVPVSIPYEDGSGVAFARVFAGAGAQLNFDAASLTVHPDAASLAVNIVPASLSVDASRGVATFTVLAQPSGAVTIPFTTATSTLVADDTDLSRLAKLYLVAAGGGSAAAPAAALVDLRGTNLHPFSAPAALADLLGGASGSPSSSSPSSPAPWTLTTAPSTALPPSASAAAASSLLSSLLAAGDPGLETRAVTLALGAAPASLSPSSLQLPADLAGTAPALPWAVLWEELLRASPTPSRPRPATLLRNSPFPFGLDFASAVDTRIRAERMGFAEREYAFVTGEPNGGGGNVAGTSSLSAAASASSSSSPSSSLPTYLAASTPLSAFDVDRSGPPYLLLSIEVNGPPPETQPQGEGEGGGIAASALPASTASAYHGMGSSFSALRSVSEPSRQIVSATAYVHVGSDAATMRQLDRQDDRSPVAFPTSTFVHSVRFRTMRPDGRAYNFHGRRVMVALRFLTHTDNPNFVAAAQEHAKQQQQQHKS